MALNIQINKRKHFKSEDLWAMHKLRARVFKDRMGWEVPVLSGMEIDGYDAIDPMYMLIKSNAGELCGCWRVLPTSGPYMLKDSFPELLHGQTAPEAKDIWELSRFAIETDDSSGFGFSKLTKESIKEMMAYGKKHKIKRYVTVTTTAIERLLRRAGVVTSRLGPPVVIGVETAVALYLEVSESYDGVAHLLAAA